MFGAEHSIFFDQTFLLTGATEGLGPSLARGLVAQGAVVLAIDRNAGALAAMQRGLGDTFRPLARDLADPKAPVEVARWIAEDHPRLAGMVCNAGGMASRTSCEPETSLRTVFGPAALAGLLWPALSDTGRTTFALVLPEGDLATGFAQLTSTLRRQAWNTGQRSSVTTATIAPWLLAATPDDQSRAASRILTAIDRGKPHLCLRAPWFPPGPARRSRLGICPVGEADSPGS